MHIETYEEHQKKKIRNRKIRNRIVALLIIAGLGTGGVAYYQHNKPEISKDGNKTGKELSYEEEYISAIKEDDYPEYEAEDILELETEEQTTEPITEEATERITEEVSEDATEVTTEVTTEEDTEAETEEKTEVTTEEVSEVTTELVTENNTEDVTESTVESEIETTTEAITETTTELVSEESTEKATETVTEEITEVDTEDTTEVETEEITEVTTEAETEVITEAETESETEAVTEDTTMDRAKMLAEFYATTGAYTPTYGVYSEEVMARMIQIMNGEYKVDNMGSSKKNVDDLMEFYTATLNSGAYIAKVNDYMSSEDDTITEINYDLDLTDTILPSQEYEAFAVIDYLDDLHKKIMSTDSKEEANTLCKDFFQCLASLTYGKGFTINGVNYTIDDLKGIDNLGVASILEHCVFDLIPFTYGITEIDYIDKNDNVAIIDIDSLVNTFNFNGSFITDWTEDLMTSMTK